MALLLARAVLVLDADNKVTYVEYPDNINSEPNYVPEAVKVLITKKRSMTSFLYLQKSVQNLLMEYDVSELLGSSMIL